MVLLEELCLKDNGLTVASLSGLTSVMDLVRNDLKDLDLSDNAISVNDPDDVIPWEGFLQSLSKCCVLRRLDLSGNQLGTKAFEVLARVYAKEGPIDLVLPEELEDLDRDSLAEREYYSAFKTLPLCDLPPLSNTWVDDRGADFAQALRSSVTLTTFTTS